MRQSTYDLVSITTCRIASCMNSHRSPIQIPSSWRQRSKVSLSYQLDQSTESPLDTTPFLLSTMASVFPLEIFERIIDLSMDDEVPIWAKNELLKWSRVCHAWRRRCLPRVVRTKKFSWPSMDTLYSFRRQALLRPDLASLMEEIEVLQELRPYGHQLEMMPIVVYPHLPRLRRVTLRLMMDSIGYTYSHRYFRISSLRFDSVTELRLNGLLLRDTAELDLHLSMFPQTRTLCLRNVWWRPQPKKAWPRPPKLVPPIADLELTREGTEVSPIQGYPLIIPNI